jgi:phosphomannomutase
VKEMVEFKTEDINLEEGPDGIKILKLPELTEEEKLIIDPIVAPTSGLRIQIYDIIEENNEYYLTNRKFFLFLRVFKAISEKYKELKGSQNLKILIVTDNRSSRNLVLDYCSQIFAYEGFDVFHQKEESGESRVSAPYGAASVKLYNEIDLIIVLTASHNDISWNGIKFYIEYAMPMSGKLFKDISAKAIEYKEIHLKTDYSPVLIDAVLKNNDYVIQLLSKVLEIKTIKDKNIVIWPYLGKARGIIDLFKYYGANVTLIDEEINPPNPIKVVREDKLKEVMEQVNSNIALLLDADRDRISLYIKQNGEYFTYIPNEIYSAMHNILARDFNKKVINVRTIPSDLRGDHTSFINLLTGVGYKHLGIILYFLMDVEVEQSKVNTAILYMEDEEGNLVKINNRDPLIAHVISLMEKQELENENFIIVMWEESGGHTIEILNVTKEKETGNFKFESPFPLIADKYPVPALVVITELICRGYVISESIDWSIVGINRTIPASDEEKVKLMKNFEINDGKTIKIGEKEYQIKALSDNNNLIDIYQLTSNNSTLYFRPSGTGPDVRFYVFGKRETYLKEIKTIQDYVKGNYL